MFLTTRRVADAGAATSVTLLVPLSAPSVDPSVKADPVSSAHADVKSGLVVAAAPDMATTMLSVVASNTKMPMLSPYEINHAKAVGVTLPDPPVAATVMLPDPFVMLMPVPAVSVALVSVLPVELPIKSWPSVYDDCPVPPFATATVPVVIWLPLMAMEVFVTLLT